MVGFVGEKVDEKLLVNSLEVKMLYKALNLISDTECPISNNEGNFDVGYSKFSVQYCFFLSVSIPIAANTGQPQQKREHLLQMLPLKYMLMW